jgi:hypothetical protein
MADFTVVPANVLASSSARTATETAGAAITAGQLLARSGGLMVLYDANGAAPLNVLKGVALHGSLTGQPITYATSDNNFAPGFAGLVAGDAVIGSQNPGMMCPDGDKAAGWYVTELGRAIDATHIKLNIIAVGVVR